MSVCHAAVRGKKRSLADIYRPSTCVKSEVHDTEACRATASSDKRVPLNSWHYFEMISILCFFFSVAAAGFLRLLSTSTNTFIPTALTPLNKHFMVNLSPYFACSVFNAALLLLLLFLYNDWLSVYCLRPRYGFTLPPLIGLWVYNKDDPEVSWLHTHSQSTVTEKSTSDNFHRDSSLVQFEPHIKKKKKKNMAAEDLCHE